MFTENEVGKRSRKFHLTPVMSDVQQGPRGAETLSARSLF